MTALDHLNPERRTEEALAEWLQSYFTGQPHHAPGGPFIYPKLKPIFNADVVTRDGTLPTLHCSFIEWPREERWLRQSDLGTWAAVLARPASGVSYGRSASAPGTIIESVHGKKRRTLPGTDLRWQTSGSDLLEQTLVHGTWATQRTIANAASLVWQRLDGTNPAAQDYVETTNTGTELRRITPADALWDGAQKVVEGRAVFAWYALVNVGGDLQRARLAARTIAANLEASLRDPVKTALLAQHGLRAWEMLHGARSLPVQAAQCQYLSTTAIARYRLPREHTT